jgi:molybdate transport repressor ModE-like protein
VKIESAFYAVEIADTGSFSQAARNLYLSQPNLSYAVRQLERELGVRLFDRSSGGAVVTPEGQEIIERFRIIRREYEEINEFAGHLRSDRKSLWIGSMSSSRGASAFYQFASRHTDEEVSLSFQNFTTLDEVLRRLCCSQLDLALFGILSLSHKIALSKFASSGVEYHLLGMDEICAAVGEKNPLYSGADTIRMEDLYPYVGIQYGTAADNPDHALLHATGLGVHLKGEISVTDPASFYDCIRGSSAFGLIAAGPEHYRHYSRNAEGIRILHLSDCQLYGEYYWVRMPGRTLSGYAKEFLGILEKLY